MIDNTNIFYNVVIFSQGYPKVITKAGYQINCFFEGHDKPCLYFNSRGDFYDCPLEVRFREGPKTGVEDADKKKAVIDLNFFWCYGNNNPG